MCHVSSVTCHLSRVMCQVSQVLCHMLRVTCHFSLTPTATATDPPAANSPTMHSRLVCKHQTNQKNSKRKKSSELSKNLTTF